MKLGLQGVIFAYCQKGRRVSARAMWVWPCLRGRKGWSEGLGFPWVGYAQCTRHNGPSLSGRKGTAERQAGRLCAFVPACVADKGAVMLGSA